MTDLPCGLLLVLGARRLLAAQTAWLPGLDAPSLLIPIRLISYQAMASGTPVLLPNSGGVVDTVLDKMNGFLCEPDSRSFASKVRRPRRGCIARRLTDRD